MIGQIPVGRVEAAGESKPLAQWLTDVVINRRNPMLSPRTGRRVTAENIQERMDRIGQQIVIGQGGQLGAGVGRRAAGRQAVEDRIGSRRLGTAAGDHRGQIDELLIVVGQRADREFFKIGVRLQGDGVAGRGAGRGVG